MIMTWTLNPEVSKEMAPDLLGFIPSFIDADDPRPAREQLDANYQHGGGWRPTPGFKLNEFHQLEYPGDPLIDWVAAIFLRKELIMVYWHGWVMIQQPDDSYEVARMD